MTSEQALEKFLQRRRQLQRWWPLAGSALLLLWAGLGAWLFLTRPLLINPVHVAARLGEGAIEQPTLVLMAGMLPVAMLCLLAVVLVVVLFTAATMANEKRYLAIIDRLRREQSR